MAKGQSRLHIVTGKGGTGKTTVAAALALALASEGKDVLLCEVEGRQGIARIFDLDPLPYEERRIASGPDKKGNVYALHIDPESALLEYLALYYKLGRAGRALDRFGVIEFATTIAPGVRDVLLTGKVFEAAKDGRKGKNARQYDAVVLDAPPTGRIAQFLGVNSELAGLAKMGPIKSQADMVMTLFRSKRTAIHLVTVLEEMPVQETTDGIADLTAAGLPIGAVIVNQELAGLARMGPIKSQADSVTTLFRSPQTACHLVTVLEEMPVQETADGIAHIREVGLPVGGVVVNQVRSRDLRVKDLAAARTGELDRAGVAADLAAAGVEVRDELVDGLLAEARDHAVRRALEDAQRKLVKGLGVPTYELPRLAQGVDMGGLYELAAVLRDQGLA